MKGFIRLTIMLMALSPAVASAQTGAGGQLIMQWAPEQGLTLFDLIQEGGEMIAVDSFATPRGMISRSYFVKLYDKLYQCGEVGKEGGRPEDQGMLCSRLVRPFDPRAGVPD